MTHFKQGFEKSFPADGKNKSIENKVRLETNLIKRAKDFPQFLDSYIAM